MEKKLLAKDFNVLNDRDRIRGSLLLKDAKAVNYKDDRWKIVGNCSTSDGNIAITVWDSNEKYEALAKRLETSAVINQVISFEGVMSVYRGEKSVSLYNFEFIDDSEVSKETYMYLPYEKTDLSKKLDALVRRNVSATGLELLKKIFANPKDVERFEVEYAATSHHDNCCNGLMAHTYKVLAHLEHLLDVYPSLIDFDVVKDLTPAQRKDLLYIGLLIHDMDKVTEMTDGVYNKLSGANHRTLTIVRLGKLSSDIITLYNQEWFNHLVAVISQHHGEYGEPVTTLYSKIANDLDDLDAKYTVIAENLRTSNVSGLATHQDVSISVEVATHTIKNRKSITI